MSPAKRQEPPQTAETSRMLCGHAIPDGLCTIAAPLNARSGPATTGPSPEQGTQTGGAA